MVSHRSLFIAGAALAVAVGMSSGWLNAQGSVAPPNDLPNGYRLDETWKPQLPADRKLGASGAIAMDPDGQSIWMADRCGGATGCADSKVAPVMKFDASGRLLRSFGGGMFALVHGLDVDREGNVWVADNMGAPGKGHVVVKFSPTGQVLMTLGKAGEPGDGPDRFNQPSDVLVAPNGDIFVADGHGGDSNARIVKFSKDGRFIKTWGRKGTAPGEFDAPHALVLDSDGRLIVADRTNNRLQVFDQDGRFLAEWKQFGRISGLFVRDGMLFATDTHSSSMNNPGVKRGVRIGNVKDGQVRMMIPDPSDPVTVGNGGREAVVVDRDGNVFLPLLGNGGILKFVKGGQS